jgi:hypothetical protein
MDESFFVLSVLQFYGLGRFAGRSFFSVQELTRWMKQFILRANIGQKSAMGFTYGFF